MNSLPYQLKRIEILRSVQKLHRPIFIIGCHKSGASLLRALLDHHPNLAVLPRESHFFEFLGRGVQYPLRGSDPVPVHDPGQRILELLSNETTSSDPYSDSPNFPGYSRERLLHMAKTLRWETTEEALTDFLEGLYEAANDEQINERRLVEKSVENAEFIPTLDHLTDGAQFVAIVRNPYANFVALRRQKSHPGGRYPLVRSLIESLRHHYMGLARAKIGDAADITIIRYEDLVTNLKAVTRDLAAFLGEPWTESLLTPSERGEPWTSNSTWTAGFEVGTASLYRWQNDIRGFEVGLVNSYLEPLLREYGYQPLQAPSPGRWLLPQPKESIRNWLFNRATTAQGVHHRPWL